MKILNRTTLEPITLNGFIYSLDMKISSSWSWDKKPLDEISATLKKEGIRSIIVKVLARSLKGKTDLHDKPYQPTQWIFTCKPL